MPGRAKTGQCCNWEGALVVAATALKDLEPGSRSLQYIVMHDSGAFYGSVEVGE
jgi:hypothetical protein